MQHNSRIAMILALAIFMAYACAGCAHQGEPMTPAGRGLFLVDQYDNLEATYINYLRYADPEAEAWARANVGATLDRMRLALIVYSEVVAAGGDATASRLEVVELMRQALLKLAEAKDK